MYRIIAMYHKPWARANSDMRRKFYNALKIDYRDNNDPATALKKMRELLDYCESRRGADPVSEFIVLNHNAGVFCQALGEYSTALAHLDKVLAVYPEEPASFLTRATVKEDLGDLKGAYNDYSAYQARVGRGEIKECKSAGINNIGVMDFKKKNYEAAAQWFEIALNIDNSTPGGYHNCGVAKAHAGVDLPPH